ncbi:transcription factor bHLH112-like isoform X1 [Cucurbita maxima]|uniref:Transcription factor bHLH112-like isoform X1 n=1 Tax=Cucurbita maxima TaxID=3661 RepID=A0A6J1KQE4_CUCMA|nr:transcription factor bHLH112-like isoform X1 [Cucurbita maxima]
MAEDFQAAICGDNWWSFSRNMMVTVGGLSPCSVGIGDLGWPPADDFLDIKPKSATDSDHNNNSMLFQDYSTFQMMGFALSSSTTSDHWNQPDGLLCGGGRGESNFNSNGIERYKDEEITRSFTSDSSFINGLKQGDDEDYNMLEQNGLMSTTNTPTCQGLFPLDSTLYGYPHQQQQQQQPPPPHAHSLFNSTHPQPQPVSAALHFANNTPFWNAPTAASSTHIPQGIASLLEQKSAKSQNSLKPINNGNCENGQEPKKGDKNSANESVPVFKRPRIETPSPLPTFKVRKEKLGDRVTALQQLVSPFGKTDTASVLHEAIEYIKFLHDQVSVLSTPYMKSNNGITPTQQHQQVCEKEDPDCPKQDLRSRGLCLVPVSSTFPVSNVGTADFWTPTFGGTFR